MHKLYKNSNFIFKAFEKQIEQTKLNRYKSTIGDFVLIPYLYGLCLNSLAMLATQINGSLFYTLLLIPKEENVAIYRRIEGFQHDISWRNIDPAIFRDLSREIGDLSRYIGDLSINRRFFSDISCGQRVSTKIKPTTVPVNTLQ